MTDYYNPPPPDNDDEKQQPLRDSSSSSGGGASSAAAAAPLSRMSQISLASVSSAGRRLPVYLLLDCSESMAGPYLESVRHGLTAFKNDVLDFEPAAATVHVGIITFASRARLVTGEDLVPIRALTPPPMEARGTTHLGGALRMLQDCIARQVRRKSSSGGPLADFRPLVFILTDGEPSDEDVWPRAREDVQYMVDRREISVVTVGCGPGINLDNMREIAIGDSFFMMEDSSKSFRMFFQWVASSVVAQSQAVSRVGTSGSQSGFSPQPPRSDIFFQVT